ncbi:MAG: dodecin family protein [Saprospiraceae bacterium]
MATIKVIEVLASSNKSWSDAAEQAIKKAHKTIKNIRSANIKNLGVTVENGKIKEYRINAKLSFELE